jgi:hypothetical protein
LAAERLVSTGVAAPSLSVEVGVVEPLMARYTPHWLPLAEVPAFIGATEQNMHDCRSDICNALSDREIAARVTIGAPASPQAQEASHGGASGRPFAGDQSFAPASDLDGRVFEGDRVDVPERLHPDDLDWERSCPREPWYIRGNIADRLLPIGSLELSTKDLMRLFGKPQPDDASFTYQASSVSSTRKPNEASGPRDLPVTPEQFRLAGDVLPLLLEWATWRYNDRALPSRRTLIQDHRDDYGNIPGITELAMRALRHKSATPEQKRGGAPTQQRYRPKRRQQ